MSNDENKKIFEAFKQDKENGIIKFDRTLGKGSYGEIRDVQINTSYKIMAAKLITKEPKNKDCLSIVKDLRGPNIVKIVHIISKMIDNKPYSLVIMEKAALRDLGKLSEFFHNYNLLRTINKPFNDYKNESYTGENLLRFYVKQIVEGMEILNRYSLVHFDIKPENLLTNNNIKLKICDFSLLTKFDNTTDELKIPGGTHGYTSPEYYSLDKVSKYNAIKQDMFGLGSTLFNVKYGKPLISGKKTDKDSKTHDNIKYELETDYEFIRSKVAPSDDFNKFLLQLISMDKDERTNFEELYRNKWINKNGTLINVVYSNCEGDEEKLLMELEKSDFLETKIEKKKAKKFKLKLKKNKFQN